MLQARNSLLAQYVKVIFVSQPDHSFNKRDGLMISGMVGPDLFVSVVYLDDRSDVYIAHLSYSAFKTCSQSFAWSET